MPQRMIYRLIIGFTLLLTISCNQKNANKELNTSYDTDYSLITLDSINYNQQELKLYFTDSSIYFNHIIAGQVSQFMVNKYQFIENRNSEKFSFIISTPLREEKEVIITLPLKNFKNIQEKFQNPVFADFIVELFKLNEKYQELYDKDKSSLLDKINSFFALAVHDKHKSETEEFKYFFGYDSYDIFIQYFNDCKNQNKSEATELVNLLFDDTLFIKPEIRPELNKLINKYCKK